MSEESTKNQASVRIENDAQDLTQYGYQQQLKRALGPVGSFAIAFSMISITTAIFYLLPSLFADSGGIGIWLWIPAGIGVFMIVLVYSHLSARMPITGFAYQWTSRLTNVHYGWFTGWSCLCAFFAGTASIAAALASIFAPDVWANPTHGDVVLFAVVALLVGVVINTLSIRLVAWVNNVGAAMEVVGAVFAAILLFFGSLFFFHHNIGGHVLLQRGAVLGGVPLWYGLVLASLLPVFTLLGWEGAADLSEETLDPRRVTPTAMIRSNYLSSAFALFIVLAFVIAIPHGVKAMLAQPKNPLLYIFGSHFGQVPEDLLSVAVFAAVFSCMLANMVVATRLCYALARDNMLPASKILARVPRRTQTPVASILLVGAIAIGVNLLSQGIAANVVSIVNLAYYSIYLLVLAGVFVAVRNHRVPDAPEGYFSLGRWLKPVMTVALIWVVIVMVVGATPQAGHVGFEYLLGAEAVGVVWYLLVLRSRLTSKRAGVGRHVLADESEFMTRPFH